MSLDIYTWHWTLTLVVLAGTLLKQKVLGSFSPVVTFTILGNVKLQRERGRERARERARERERVQFIKSIPRIHRNGSGDSFLH